MDNDPMYIPVQQRYLSNTRNYEQEGLERMSVDEMKHLLIMMGTITVISFILVVSIVTILAAFIWYSRRRLSRSSAATGSQHPASTKCTCSAPPSAAEWNCVEAGGLSGKEVFVNAGYVYPSPGPAGVHSVGGNNFSYHSGAKVTQVLQPPIYSRFMAAEPDTWSLQTDRSSHSGRRLIIPQLNSSHNVIVNPLPPLPQSGERETPYNVPAADLHYPYNHLLSDTHANKPSNPPNSPAQTNTKPADISFEQNTNSSEDPIYQEIGVGKKEKINNDPTNENEEENLSNESEANTGKVGQKKEIEYWQITAKEVVKFRPCTETFINRNNV